MTAGGDETDDEDPDTAGPPAAARRSAIDDAAIDAVLTFERAMGREPEPMDHSNPGFDIKSVEPDGSLRYIEVKGTASTWDGLGDGITSRQYQEASDWGEQFWLYVVVITTDGPSEPFRIQDPLPGSIGAPSTTDGFRPPNSPSLDPSPYPT